ncbi:proprotein convertase P-domain-containing protein [Membranihabitans maritimus]|uniref:proprotein convertase P-domain-containing protein n=1 Tax=Membranihabitans maritimus TaxID=2904244 RepID=UPI001F013652|nr:proprotein convertase P-domain-containing protein [Membranihabitans maritimus]
MRQLLLLLFIVGVAVTEGQAQCKIQRNIPIPDNGTVQNIKIEANSSNISGELLCGVRIHFDHEFVGDLNIVVISPTGKRLNLLQSSNNSSKTDNSSWDITFVRDEGQTSPDDFKKPLWSDNIWTTNTQYTGSYLPADPNGFEFFDSEASIGTWNVNIRDDSEGGTGTFYSVELVFCSPTQFCRPCNESRNLMANQNLGSFCGGDQALESISPQTNGGNITPGFTTTYVAVNGNRIVALGQPIDLSNQNKGDYRIFTIQHRPENLDVLQSAPNLDALRNLFHSNSSQICGAVSGNHANITILSNPNPREVTRNIYGKDFYIVDGTRYTSDQTITQNLTDKNGCDSTVLLTLNFTNYTVSFNQSAQYSCNTTDIDLSVSNSEDFPVHRWFTKNGLISNQSDLKSNSITVQSPGTYSVVFEIEDYLDTVSHSVSSAPGVPVFSLENSYTLCNNSSVQAELGTNFTNYIVIPSSGVTVEQNVITFEEAGDYLIQLEGEECTIEKNVLIIPSNESNSVQITGGQILCDGTPALLEPQLDQDYETYRWILDGAEIASTPTLSVTTPGTYFFEASNDGACGQSGSVTVRNAFETVGLDIEGIDAINCRNIDSMNYLKAFYSGPFTATWTTPDGSTVMGDSVLVTAEGNYSVNIASGTCEYSAEKTVSRIESTVAFNVPTSVDLVCDQPTTPVEATNFSSTYYSIRWRGTGLTYDENIAQVSEPGNIQVIVTDSSSFCADSANITVNQNPNKPLFEDPVIPAFRCDNTGSSLSFTAQVENCDNCTWSIDSDANITIDPTTGRVTAQEPGSFVLTAKNEQGCQSILTRAFPDQTNATPPNIEIQPISCTSETGRFEITNIFDEDNTLHYEIIRLEQEDGTIINEPEFDGQSYETNTPQTLYLLYRENSTQCIDTAEIEIINSENGPSIEYDETQMITCDNQQATLALQSEQIESVVWQRNGISIAPTGKRITVAEPGNYTFVATDTENCDIPGSIEVIDGRTTPELPLQEEYTIACTDSLYGLEYDLNLDLRTIKWQGPGGFTSSDSFPDLPGPGQYFVELENTNGCVNNQSVMVIRETFSREVEIIAETLTCEINPGKAHLDSYEDIQSVAWIDESGNLSTRDTFEFFSTGTISVVIENTRGCQRSEEVMVTEDLETVNTAIEPAVINCDHPEPDLTIQINGNPQRNVITEWYLDSLFLEESTTLTVIQPATYTAVSYFDNGCRDTSSFEVTANFSIPILRFPKDTLSCRNSKLKLPDSVGTQALRSTIWTGPEGFSSEEAQPIFTTPGEYFLDLTAKNGCKDTATFRIAGDLEPPVYDSVGFLSLSCTGGEVPLSYVTEDSVAVNFWQNPAGDNFESPTTTIRDSGNYILYLEGPNGCFKIDTFPVFETIKPSTTLNVADANCRDKTGNAGILLDNQFLTAEWLNPVSQEIIGVGDSINNLEIGVYDVRITNSLNQCDSIYTFEIRDAATLMELEIAVDDSLRCEKDSTNLLSQISPVSDHYVYKWTESISDEIVISDQPRANNIRQEGIYRLRVTDTSNFCTISSEFIVEKAPNPLQSFVLSIQEPACDINRPGTIIIDSISGALDNDQVTYSLDQAAFNPLDTFNLIYANQNYVITGRDQYGCELDTLINLELKGIMDNANPLQDTLVNSGDSVDFNQPGFKIIPSPDIFTLDYEWILNPDTLGCFSCTEPELKQLFNSRTVITTITNEYGCSISDTFNINVRQADLLDVPNAIIPESSNSENSHTCIYANQYIENVESFIIFGRNGDIVFKRENINPLRPIGDYSNCWDGMINGNPLPMGTYNYYVKYLTVYGEMKEKYGDIVLLR